MKIVVICVVLIEIVLINGAVVQNEKFSCVMEVPYILNECQNCICTGEKLGCTRSACYNNRQFKNCEVGTVWLNECNKCWCLERLGTVCTANICKRATNN
ncbi:hypothetical protein ILUMI_04305 [Ignelater luminosus]|uniref:Pacifastin domain-containing protein n=1 Tax=Ignelater luminosus TaxID=2038154 RepID=A0A8K0DEL4_IGNLU|nr:hypothetical protein ILUMI_04305 [Ignelater luminosus]